MTPESTRREFLLTVAWATGAAGTTAAGQATGEPTGSPAADQTDAARGTAERGPDSGAWPMHGFDAGNTSFNPDIDGPERAVGKRWEVLTGGRHSSPPALADGVAYVGAVDGTLYAVDVEEATQLWTFATGGEIPSTPTVHDGMVYVGSEDGRLYAISAQEGNEVWSVSTDDAIVASPAVAGDSVYVGSTDASVYGVDTSDGSIRWEFETAAPVESTPAIHIGEETAGEDDPAGSDHHVYVGDDFGFLYAIDGASGGAEWTLETGSSLPAAPTVTDESVYVANLAGIVGKLDRETGDTDWQVEAGSAIVASPAVDDERLYLPLRAGEVSALDVGDGQPVWTRDLDLPTEPPSVAGEVIVASGTRRVVGLDASTGEVHWELGANEPTAACVTGSDVYLGSGGSLFALAPGFEEPIVGSPTQPDRATDDANPLAEYRFLLWPITILAGVSAFVGLAYAAKRGGLFDRFEAWTDSIEPMAGEDKETAAPTVVWELVVDDVIRRAERTHRSATQDLIVTKYVDRETLAAPVVAYEIESVRDDSTGVRLAEPLAESDLDEESRPLGDSWSVEGDQVVFEREIAPGETVKTIVGRRDCSPEDVAVLLNRPDVSVG